MGGACAANAEISPTMKLVRAYSPAQPAWGNSSFITKKGRGGLERGEVTASFFSGSVFPPHVAARSRTVFAVRDLQAHVDPVQGPQLCRSSGRSEQRREQRNTQGQ